MAVLPDAAAVLGLVALSLWAVMSLWWPFGRDQGAMAWCGHVFSSGGALYADAWDLRGPACYLQFAAAEVVFGRNMWGVRVLDVVLLGGGMLGVGALAAHMGGVLGALWAAVFFGLWYAGLGYASTAEPDGWAAMLTAAATSVCVAGGAATVGRLALAGALMGWVACLKPLFILLSAVPLVASRVARATPPQDSRCDRISRLSWKPVGAYVIGLGGVVAVVLCCVDSRGSLSEMVEILGRYTWEVYRRTAPFSVGRSVAGILDFLSSHAPVILLAGWGLLWGRGVSSARRATLCWGLIASGLVLVQNKFYPYHWVPVLAPLAILAGHGIRELFRQAQIVATATPGDRRWKLWAATSCAALTGLCTLGAPARAALSDFPAWLGWLCGRVSYGDFYSRFGAWGERDFCYMAHRAVASYVVRRTAPQSYVYVWGYGPLISYIADRPCPSRFCFTHPLVASRLHSDYFWRKYKCQLIADLSAHPPAYLVVGDKDANLATPVDAAAFLAEFPELRELIARKYVMEERIENFTIYRALDFSFNVGGSE